MQAWYWSHATIWLVFVLCIGAQLLNRCFWDCGSWPLGFSRSDSASHRLRHSRLVGRLYLVLLCRYPTQYESFIPREQCTYPFEEPGTACPCSRLEGRIRMMKSLKPCNYFDCCISQVHILLPILTSQFALLWTELNVQTVSAWHVMEQLFGTSCCLLVAG